jgi:hypothetical protein
VPDTAVLLLQIENWYFQIICQLPWDSGTARMLPIGRDESNRFGSSRQRVRL